MKKKMLGIFKLNRKKGVRELSKFLINEIADKNTKILSRQLMSTQLPFENIENPKKTNSITEESVQCSENYTIDFIK